MLTDGSRLFVVAIVAIVVIALAARATRRTRPRPGQVWFAEVPFEDASGSKDRPVLILAVDGRTCEAAAFTSQAAAERHHAIRVPRGVPGLDRASWIRPHPTTLHVKALRRCAGDPGQGLVTWYDGARAGR